MSTSESVVSQTSPQPGQIPLLESVGLLPSLAESRDKVALLKRLAIQDDIVRVDALCELLDGVKGTLTVELLKAALYLARRSSYLRQKLLPHLIRGFRFDAVQKLSEFESHAKAGDSELRERLIHAVMNNAYAEQVDLHGQLYLQTGDKSHLDAAFDVSCASLGWRDAFPVFLRNVLVQVKPVQGLSLTYLKLLEREDARQQFTALGKILANVKSASLCHVYTVSQSMFWSKNYEKCISVLEESKAIQATAKELPLFTNLAASAAEKMGNFHLAAKYYHLQGECLRSKAPLPEDYIKELDERASWEIGELPKDPRSNYFVMTGFPRSGTTLLENILSSHPLVETCEETSSLVGSISAAYKTPIKDDPECQNLTLRAAQHRRLYYRNLNRYITKAAPQVVIDKTPIMSSNIKYMEKIFPEKKYIFSVRHPYDVVLSNYKQDYSQNSAMASFNDVRSACVLYNKVMSDWFEVFPHETPRVHYVKYDELVIEFDRVVSGVLDFLGVGWTDEVRRFAENSANRPVRTPSYAKVRQGLGIGVQTSWQNFDFLFNEECKALLDPWVRRFGYAA